MNIRETLYTKADIKKDIKIDNLNKTPELELVGKKLIDQKD